MYGKTWGELYKVPESPQRGLEYLYSSIESGQYCSDRSGKKKENIHFVHSLYSCTYAALHCSNLEMLSILSILFYYL